MKPTFNKALPCSVFGHNYIRTKTNIDYTLELTCSHCDAVVVTDRNGNFDSITVSNTQIKDTMQELYRLIHRFQKAKVS
ncbi:hypothetical protein [Winogradskyella sp. UBA3174]|uniref:hypothetical protein n=1 Tax=Winogradskyella sp. UBA3174 TaxID=1947785 RepID=UPI0025DD2CBB|nr:hypothetical protein [Winogradskyella sp. UBA3174]